MYVYWWVYTCICTYRYVGMNVIILVLRDVEAFKHNSTVVIIILLLLERLLY